MPDRPYRPPDRRLRCPRPAAARSLRPSWPPRRTFRPC